MGRLTRLSGDYWRFWAATAVSNLGDGIRWVALPLVAVTLTRDPLLISGIGALLFALAMALPFAVDASTYLIGAVLVWFVRVDLSPAPAESVDAAPHRLRREVAEGFRYTFTQPLLRGIAVSAAGANFGASAGGAVLVLLAVDVLGLSEVGLGLLLGVGALGGVLGASLASRASAAIGRGRALFAGMALGGIGMAVLGLAPDPVVAGAALFVSSATATAYNVVNQSLRQAITPPRLLGRVITSVRFVGLGAVPVGALTGGALARVAGVRSPYLLAAGSFWLAAAVVARTLGNEAITAGLADAAAREGGPPQGPRVGPDRASD